jgi:hypothetical protein
LELVVKPDRNLWKANPRKFPLRPDDRLIGIFRYGRDALDYAREQAI